MSTRNYIDNAPTHTLTVPVNNSLGQITLDSLTGLPTSYPYTGTLEIGTASAEVVEVTSLASGTTLNVTRNFDGLGAFSHGSSASFDHTAVALDYQEANAHNNATSGVHGIAGHVVGDTDTQTLSGKTLTSPVINNPTVVGGTTSGVTHINDVEDGDLTHPALKAQVTVAGGKALSLLDHTGAEKASVDEAGDATFSGSVTAGSFVGAGVLPTGAVVPYAGLVIPSGFILCDGSAVSRSTYATLFSKLAVGVTGVTASGVSGTGPFTQTLTMTSTAGFTAGMRVTAPGGAGLVTLGVAGVTGTTLTFNPPGLGAGFTAGGGLTITGHYNGAGDNSTTFNLPDLRSQFVMGADDNGVWPGTTGGSNSHTHPLSANGQALIDIPSGIAEVLADAVATPSYPVNRKYTATGGAVTTSSLGNDSEGVALAGATDSTTTLPPYYVLAYIIKT